MTFVAWIDGGPEGVHEPRPASEPAPEWDGSPLQVLRRAALVGESREARADEKRETAEREARLDALRGARQVAVMTGRQTADHAGVLVNYSVWCDAQRDEEERHRLRDIEQREEAHASRVRDLEAALSAERATGARRARRLSEANVAAGEYRRHSRGW